MTLDQTQPGPCGDPTCPVLHADPANPIHPSMEVLLERKVDRLEAENERLQRDYAQALRTVAAIALSQGGVVRVPAAVMREVRGHVDLTIDHSTDATVIRGR